MITGLYSAAAGLLAEEKRQDAVAENIANLETPGFRAESVYLASFPEVLASRLDAQGVEPLGVVGTGVSVAGVRYDGAEGPLQVTGRPLDVALLDPNVFLAVSTPQGVAYTRRGDLRLGGNGRLETASGDSLLNPSGQPLIPGAGASIGSDGTVTGTAGAAGTLAFYTFNDAGTLSLGSDGYYHSTAASGPAQATSGHLKTGYLELSNVKVEGEMATSIAAFRAYEEASEVLRSDNSTLDLAVNKVGQLA